MLIMVVKSICSKNYGKKLGKKKFINELLCLKTKYSQRLWEYLKDAESSWLEAGAPRWFFPTLLNAPRMMGVSLFANMSAKKFH